MRPWLERLADPPHASLSELNALAEERSITVLCGAPVRFVAPSTARAGYGAYERRVFDTGCVETRQENLHDVFNALAWLAFPRTKAALNARHVDALPREGHRRGSLRDLLTLLDEGGALVGRADDLAAELVQRRDWRTLFLDRRQHAEQLEVSVLGHAVLEQALAPWPGITCKALFLPPGPPDEQAAKWIMALPPDAAPRDLPALPVFGLPGWWPVQDEAFYGDFRYFRPAPGPTAKMPSGSRPGSRYGDIEESPGSAERDAG